MSDFLNILRVNSVKTQLIYCQFEHFLRNTWICFNEIITVVISTSFVSTFCYCSKHFGTPNVHFYLMYLKHVSIIGLMMTL